MSTYQTTRIATMKETNMKRDEQEKHQMMTMVIVRLWVI